MVTSDSPGFPSLQSLDEANKNPEFTLYLVYILVQGPALGLPLEMRQVCFEIRLTRSSFPSVSNFCVSLSCSSPAWSRVAMSNMFTTAVPQPSSVVCAPCPYKAWLTPRALFARPQTTLWPH
jgi:hypothetical protein